VREARAQTRAGHGWPARVFLYFCVRVMDDKIELKDPDHPDAEKAAEATARLLIEVREERAGSKTKETNNQCPSESSPSPI
jgi:hypothetical protein